MTRSKTMTFRARFLFVAIVASLGFASCAFDEIDKGEDGEGLIHGEITYDGDTLVTRIAVAVFDRGDNPPVTPPVKMFYDPQEPLTAGIGFPVAYEMSGLPAGEVWIMAYGDVDPEDGPLPKGIDPASAWFGPFTISDSAANVSLDMDLEDNRWDGVDQDTVQSYFDGEDEEVIDEAGSTEDVSPADGKGAIHGSISYDGDLNGKVWIVGFPTNAFDSMPTLIYPMDDETPVFPLDYVYNSVKPGTHYVYAYLNVDPDDGGGMKNTEIDPISEVVELTIGDGEVQEISFTLVLP
jgi:hypothetical protein